MNWQRRKGVVGRVHYDYPQYPTLFHREAMIAKRGLCVLDEGAVIRYVLAELLASNLRVEMRKDTGSSPKSMASQARRDPGNRSEVSGKVTLVRETRLKRNL